MAQTINLIVMIGFLLSITSFESLIGSNFVATKRGSCIKKKGLALIKMKKEDCKKIQGRFSKSSDMVYCNLDWCDVPYSGAISQSTVYTICKSDEQNLVTYSHTPIQDFRPNGIFKMKSHACKALNGKMKGNPGTFSAVNCHLKLCPFSGYNDRYELKGMLFSSQNDCSQLVSGSTLLTYSDCMKMGGQMSKMRVVGNSKNRCNLDICEVF